MTDDRSALGTNMVLFLLGAAAGAAIVALLTPKSGRELRADLKDLAGKVKRQAREARNAFSSATCREEERDNVDAGA